MKINKHTIKNFFTGLLWLAAGAGCITLLVSGVHTKDAKHCKGVEINITGADNNLFIDKHDIYFVIKNNGGDSTQHRSLAAVNLMKIEHELEKEVWVKNAELFFDNNNILKVSVEEREPVARVFTLTGNSFYIDSSCMMLPLSDKFSARLPVFTGFISDAKILAKADSNLLRDIRNISMKISADSFLMAMIDQVDINAQRSFEMTPKIGNQNIIFGDGTGVEVKFAKLKLFYKDVISKAGWNRYNTIDLQYKNQVVAKIRGKEDITADSLRTLQLMKFIAEDAARRSADSLQTIMPDTQGNTADSSLIQQSRQREENENAGIMFPVTPATVPAATGVPIRPDTVKPAAGKSSALKKTPIKKMPVKQKPKVFMPKNSNDY